MFLLLVVSVLWALSFGLTAQVSGLGAPFVTAVRTLLAALVFLPFLNLKGLAPKAVAASRPPARQSGPAHCSTSRRSSGCALRKWPFSPSSRPSS
ncbi:MAG: hypothetical protein IPO28_05485 [Holophagaceae bacterium]|nr:hypothetical protein [Holophagaceae bacterium]